MNGNGMPVMGIRPQSMPMFSKIWNNHMPTTHITMTMPNRSPELRAMRKLIKTSAAYKPSSTSAPKKPSSSASTQKMKSVGASGRRPSECCVPWNRPLPNRPPEPMATFACCRL